MSVEAITWALVQSAGSPSAKCVLLCLANYADEHGRCWPKQGTIARQTEQSVDSVQRRLKELEKQDPPLLKRERRQKKRGGWAADLFVLQIVAAAEADGTADCGAATSGTAVLRPPVPHCCGSEMNPSLTPSKESPLLPRSRGTARSRALGEHLPSAGTEVKNGAAAPAKARVTKSPRQRSSGQRTSYATGVDGRRRFNNDAARITTVGQMWITGPDANAALDEARGQRADVEPEDVHKGLTEASKQSKFQFSRATDRKPIVMGEILDWAARWAAVAVAHRRHGKPEDLCGGAVAHVDDGYRNAPLTTELVALSDARLVHLLAAYPAAQRGTGDEKFDVAREFRRVAHEVGEVGKAEYGVGLQARFEAAFEACIAAAAGRVEAREARQAAELVPVASI